MYFPPKDSNIPVSTTGANNTGMVEDLEEQKDAQRHSESSPSKPLASPEPMVKENIVEVDSTLDQFFEQWSWTTHSDYRRGTWVHRSC